MLSSWANTLRNFLPIPPVDPRTPAEIDTDIHDEIAFHLEQAARTIAEDEDIPLPEAEIRARRNFGNINQIARTLKSIALKETLMLQRINTALMIIVVLVMLGISAQVFITQRYNTLALQTITADLTNLKLQQEIDAQVGHIFIEGAVENPGRYEFNYNEDTSLADILRQAGAQSECDVLYDGLTLLTTDLFAPGAQATRLRNGETAHVFPYKSIRGMDGKTRRRNQTPRNPFLGQLPGRWQQADADGAPIPDGIVLDIQFVDDFMKSSRALECAFTLPDEEFNLNLAFMANHLVRMVKTLPKEMQKYRRSEGSNLAGKWAFVDNTLLLNLASYSPTPDQPLHFCRLTEMPTSDIRYPASISQTIDSETLPGKWRQIDDTGTPLRDGITLEIISATDVMNFTGATICDFTHPSIKRLTWESFRAAENAPLTWESIMARLEFKNAGELEINSGVSSLPDPWKNPTREFSQMSRTHRRGRWNIYENHLLLNLGPELAPDPDHPLVFERIEK